MSILATEDGELTLAALPDAIRPAAPDAEVHGFSDKAVYRAAAGAST